jgi:deazaflavin-dependent oxidoreductase (nitroreductase family)
MSGDTLYGIPRNDLHARPVWKRNLAWWTGGRLVSTKAGSAVWRKIVAPIEAPMMKATSGHMRVSVGMPVVVLTSIGARSGKRWETPLAYFTDGDDVILIASNYGRERHPAWYHNLLAHPECELHIGPRGGPFVARETQGADRDRLYALAVERLNKGWARYEQRVNGIRTIPIMRLTPGAGVANGPGEGD